MTVNLGRVRETKICRHNLVQMYIEWIAKKLKHFEDKCSQKYPSYTMCYSYVEWEGHPPQWSLGPPKNTNGVNYKSGIQSKWTVCVCLQVGLDAFLISTSCVVSLRYVCRAPSQQVMTSVLRTLPSYVLTTRIRGQLYLGRSFSQRSTTSPLEMLGLASHHFCRGLRVCRYSFLHRIQSWSAKYWARRHCLRP